MTGLAGIGLSRTVLKVIAFIAVPLIAIALLWWALDSYGDKRYVEGKADADAEWLAASDRLKAEAAKSITRADDRAAERLGEYKEQIDEEQKAIDDAVANGSSPFDVLFGN